VKKSTHDAAARSLGDPSAERARGIRAEPDLLRVPRHMPCTLQPRMLRAWCVFVLASCLAGPTYRKPAAPLPIAATFKGAWKTAHPADAIPRGKWWTMFHDAELDALETRLDISNQTIAQAMAAYVAARAQVRAAIAGYFPTVTAAPTGIAFRTADTGRRDLYTAPLDITWAPDLFGRVRYAVQQGRYSAQVSAADLESTRLLAQAALAGTYFQLRGQDALLALLDATVAADSQVVDLVRQRFQAGLAEEVAVVQAELTLQLARVQASNAAILRDTLEDAIATLLGTPATDVRLARRALAAEPPQIPVGTPSQLLERRPDIAAAERAMAAANAAVGVATTAYFPVVSLAGSECVTVNTPGACIGFISSTIDHLLSWPSRAWAVGASLTEVLFDGGKRHANVVIARANYDATVAAYRQTVLTAFQQVETSLAETQGLAREVEQQRTAVALAQRAYDLELQRFEHGLDPYVDLMIQQIALLAAQQSLTTLQVEQMTTAVSLVEALGGGWDRSQLPPP
jgi:NodT family efflux transporter outer membrane factor (OMF) lipoprotein